MRRFVLFSLVAAGLMLVPVAPVSAEELPEDAKKVIEEHRQEAAKIRAKAEEQIKADREKVVEKLKELQETYTKAGKLDEAVAIRDRIRLIREGELNAKPDPGNLGGYRSQVGKVLYFEVTGTTNGTVYGTDIYTDDSRLGSAAVHAGVLRDGQKGIVKVTILGPQDSFKSTARNGVSTYGYQSYGGSYKVEKP